MSHTQLRRNRRVVQLYCGCLLRIIDAPVGKHSSVSYLGSSGRFISWILPINGASDELNYFQKELFDQDQCYALIRVLENVSSLEILNDPWSMYDLFRYIGIFSILRSAYLQPRQVSISCCEIENISFENEKPTEVSISGICRKPTITVLDEDEVIRSSISDLVETPDREDLLVGIFHFGLISNFRKVVLSSMDFPHLALKHLLDYAPQLANLILINVEIFADEDIGYILDNARKREEKDTRTKLTVTLTGIRKEECGGSFNASDCEVTEWATTGKPDLIARLEDAFEYGTVHSGDGTLEVSSDSEFEILGSNYIEDEDESEDGGESDNEDDELITTFHGQEDVEKEGLSVDNDDDVRDESERELESESEGGSVHSISTASSGIGMRDIESEYESGSD